MSDTAKPHYALMGRVSFSAYLLHFAVLDILPRLPAVRTYTGLTGWAAIIAFPIALLAILTVVLAASWCTYRTVELPMIELGKVLIHSRRLPVLPRLS